MKKALFVVTLLALVAVVPNPSMARVDVQVSIPLPPVIIFPAPPSVIVIPGTYAYFVPDIEEDVFFYNGWWWRPWRGRWYRSRQYASGWVYYQGIPSFYRGIPRGWRNDFREHRWKGQSWNFQPIPHRELERNWSGWRKEKYWEQNRWHVPGYQFKPRSRPSEPARRVVPSERKAVVPKPREAVRPKPYRPPSREAQTPREVKPYSQPRQSRETGSQRRQDSEGKERSGRR